MSRELTEIEVRTKFLQHIKDMVRYWEFQSDKTPLEKLDGLAFSILAALDGSSAALPSFIVAPLPHEDDKQFHIDKGTNYYPENHQIKNEIKSDIAGYLHELWHKV